MRLRLLLGLAAAAFPAAALAQATATPNLANVPFGLMAVPFSDQTNRQNTCSFTSVVPPQYSVTGTGSGAGNAFTISNGATPIPYEVQWAQAANAASGANLTAGQPLTGQTGSGLVGGLTCALGAANSTVIVIVRAAAMLQGTAGAYTGTLSILLTAQ